MESEFTDIFSSASVSLHLIESIRRILTSSSSNTELNVVHHMVNDISERLKNITLKVKNLECKTKKREGKALKCFRKMDRLLQAQQSMIQNAPRKPLIRDVSCYVDEAILKFCAESSSGDDDRTKDNCSSSVATERLEEQISYLIDRVQNLEVENNRLQMQSHRYNCLIKAQQV